MDRFIGYFKNYEPIKLLNLKSNMDRFIERFISAVTITVMI